MLLACKPKVELELLPIPCDPVSLEDVLANVRDARNHEPKVLIVGTADYKIACRIGQNQKLCNVRRGQRTVATWEIAEVFGTTTSSEREVIEAVRRLRRTIRLRSYGDADPLLIRDVSKCLGYDAAKHVERLWKKGYLRRVGKRYDLAHSFNGKFRRLAWHSCAPAVDTRFGEPRYFLHPEEHRGFSVREAAQIQGFPDSFQFIGPRAAQFRMVGNAVPPPLARKIAMSIRTQLF